MRLRIGVLLLVLATPATATAATVERSKVDTGTEIVYVAAPGETNAPQFDIDREGRSVTVSDPGAMITAADSPCTVAEGAATCGFGSSLRLRMVLGDGDDTVTLSAEKNDTRLYLDSVDGGPGNDTIDSSALEIRGGEGDDLLTARQLFNDVFGGPGNDTLTGRGDQQTFAGGPGSDRIDGGPDGEVGQTVSFADLSESVTGDLGAGGPFGPASAPDTVVNVDNVVGGRGDDLLTGSDADNDIEGGPGDDTIAGAGGNDDLDAGPGSDEVTGGDGDDQISDRGRKLTPDAILDGGEGNDRVDGRGPGGALIGGAGNDVLTFGSRNASADGGEGDDALTVNDRNLTSSENLTCGDGVDLATNFREVVTPGDCEQVGFPSSKVSVRIPNRVVVSDTSVAAPVPNTCFDRCRVTAAVLLNGRSIAEREVRLPDRENGRARLAITARAAGRIRRAGQVTLTYSARRAVLGSIETVTFPVAP